MASFSSKTVIFGSNTKYMFIKRKIHKGQVCFVISIMTLLWGFQVCVDASTPSWENQKLLNDFCEQTVIKNYNKFMLIISASCVQWYKPPFVLYWNSRRLLQCVGTHGDLLCTQKVFNNRILAIWFLPPKVAN